jgi:hypothetical protein
VFENDIDRLRTARVTKGCNAPTNDMVVGGGDTYIVSVPDRATAPAVAEGLSVIKLVEADGTWLVDAHRFVGEWSDLVSETAKVPASLHFSSSACAAIQGSPLAVLAP